MAREGLAQRRVAEDELLRLELERADRLRHGLRDLLRCAEARGAHRGCGEGASWQAPGAFAATGFCGVGEKLCKNDENTLCIAIEMSIYRILMIPVPFECAKIPLSNGTKIIKIR